MDAIQEVRNQLPKFTRIFNQHIIMRDDISDLSSGLSTQLARAEARLNVLDTAWDGHLYSRTPSSPGSFPTRNRTRFDRGFTPRHHSPCPLDPNMAQLLVLLNVTQCLLSSATQLFSVKVP